MSKMLIGYNTMPKVSRFGDVVQNRIALGSTPQQREALAEQYIKNPPNRFDVSTNDILNYKPPAAPKGKKAVPANPDEMGDIRQVRRSDRVADSVAAKAAKAASELAMKEWAKEIEKVAKEVRNDRTRINAMIRNKFADATYDELVFDSALAKQAGERFAMLALEEMIAEKVDEQIEEEKEETEEIRRLRKLLDDAPVAERESPVVQNALEELELATGVMFEFSNGKATPKVLTREEIVLRAGEKGLPVPPLTDKDIEDHKARYGPMYGVGGRRRTRKVRKSRRKYRRGGVDEQPLDLNGNPIPPLRDANGNLINPNPPPAEQPDVVMEKGGRRRKTKRSRKTRR